MDIIRLVRTPNTLDGRLTQKAKTNEMKINGDKWEGIGFRRQSGNCSGKCKWDRKEFRSYVRKVD
jgi:hypothetical protein